MPLLKEAPNYPSERLRKQLVALGIPRSDHAFPALKRFLPKNLSMAHSHASDIDILAEVLIKLVKEKLVTLAVRRGPR